MGIDIALFKATKLRKNIIKKIEHQDIDAMSEAYDFAYIDEKMFLEREKDYKELKPFLTPVLMKRTFTDREKYMAAAGIPTGLKWYSQTYRWDKIFITYEEDGKTKTVELSHDDVHKFDYVKEDVYYVYGKEYIDVEVDYSVRDIVWNVINKNMQIVHNDNEKHTYCPHNLKPVEAMQILKAIAQAYKNDDAYISDNSVAFIMELLTLNDKNMFIVGED